MRELETRFYKSSKEMDWRYEVHDEKNNAGRLLSLYSKTPIYRAPIYHEPRYTGLTFFPQNTVI